MKFNKEELMNALNTVDGVSFKESGMNRETYNRLKAVLEVAARSMTEGGIARARLSFNPSKADCMVSKSPVKPGTVLAECIDQLKRERMESVLNALKSDMLPEDVGMTDKLFAHVAKEIGVIPRSFASITDSGNYRFGKDEVKEWMAHRMAHVMELRAMAKDAETPKLPIVPIQETKKGKKAQAA